MKIPFLKMSGAGNDFVVIDRAAGPAPDWKALVPAMCDRRAGIGADGVIIIRPAAGADFTMEYFNADGSTGSLCGNGGRCAASYVMDRLGKESVSFRTLDRIYHAARVGTGVVLEMDPPGLPRLNIPLRVRNGDFVGHFLDTGSPHLVLFGEQGIPGTGQIDELGRAIRHHPEFSPSGTNVDFVSVTDKGELRIRTYERGVEAETWACGTGAVAAALIHSLLEGMVGEGIARVIPLSGELLRVWYRREGNTFSGVKLEGPVTVTFTGTYEAVVVA